MQLAVMKVSHFLFPPLFISFNCGSVHESMVMERTNEMCTLRELVCCVGGMGYGRMLIRFIHSLCVSERDQGTLLEITYPYDTQTHTQKDIPVHTTAFQTKDGSNAHTCPLWTFHSTFHTSIFARKSFDDGLFSGTHLHHGATGITREV